MRAIVTNFAYGYGPFLRTTELALEVGSRLPEPPAILVPHVYGEKQKRIMLEEFPEGADRIILDPVLGGILRRVFYADSTYEAALSAWVERYEEASADAKRHLSGPIEGETLSGRKTTLQGSDIFLELSRAPRLTYDVAPSYSATFGHISEILRATMAAPLSAIAADRALVARALPIAERLEETQALIGLAEPGTFSYDTSRVPLENEVAISPTIRAARPYEGPELAPGIYVTVTGIPGLERLYEEARALGLLVYTNDPERLPGSVKASPDALASDAILLHFARSGWGSVWGSMLLGKPTIVPAFDPADDPEIYFNNLCVEKLRLGIEYRGEPLAELMERASTLRNGIQERNNALVARFGTLDGNAVMAARIAETLG